MYAEGHKPDRLNSLIPNMSPEQVLGFNTYCLSSCAYLRRQNKYREVKIMKKLGKKIREAKNSLKAYGCTCSYQCYISEYAKVVSNQYYSSRQ